MNNTTFVLNTVVALSYAFVIFAAPGRVIAQECLNHTKDNSWSLIAAEPKPIRSIDELTDGVYSLALASTRTSCGKGQGMFRCYWCCFLYKMYAMSLCYTWRKCEKFVPIDTAHSAHLESLSIFAQSFWVSTTAPVPHPRLRTRLLVQ